MTKKIAIIISFIVLFVIIGVGIYLSLGKKPPVTQQAPPVKKLVAIQIASWKTYQNKDFSFQYPADWKLTTSKLVLPKNVLLKIETLSESSSLASSAAVITIQNGKILNQNNKPLDFNVIVSQRFVEPIFTGPKKIKLGSKDVLSYAIKETVMPTNYLTVPYDGGVGNYYELSFDYNSKSDLDYKSFFDQIISSFKFTNEK